MSIQRGVRKAKEGQAGYEVEGMPHTYSEVDAKRFQYMREDGTFDLPEDGVLEELAVNHNVGPRVVPPARRPGFSMPLSTVSEDSDGEDDAEDNGENEPPTP